MLLNFRLIVSALLLLGSGGVLYSSVQRLRYNPSGNSLLFAVNSGTTNFKIVADGQCIGTASVEGQSQSIILRARFESAEAGQVDTSLGLVFNELAQLAEGTGRVRIKGEPVLSFDIKGVTPLQLVVTKSGGIPLPNLPPVPVIITRKLVKSSIELYVQGLGARDPSKLDQAGLLSRARSKIDIVADGGGQCEYKPFVFSRLLQ